MLAAPMKKGVINDWTEWCIEVKWDGHRLLVEKVGTTVTAFARPRGDGRQVQRTLPPHLLKAFALLPDGVYDGELMGGDISTDVARLDLAHTLAFVVFDVLEVEGADLHRDTYEYRRKMLEGLFSMIAHPSRNLLLTPSLPLTCEGDATKFVAAVWEGGGEGAILKRKLAPYHVGKRTPDWIKVKRVEHAALTVVGFEATRGTVMNRGPFAVVVLEDEHGNRTTCKTKDDWELKRFMTQWSTSTKNGLPYKTGDPHPALGRKLVIEFQQRTRSGGYRGPVLWDRWENE